MPSQINEKLRWIDPHPEITGVLLSDQIEYYIKKINLIDIEDFNPDCLQPASYVLHVGDEYYINDKRKSPNKKGEIKIPRNGLVYVKLNEQINLPYYLIAQHDLKVKQVYRGLLAGRSLQIDPGYCGHINYPIFNFTHEDKIIKVGDELTLISFFKTTSFGSKDFWEVNEITSEKRLKEIVVQGLEGFECVKFKDQKDRIIPEYWYKDDTHKSSVWELERGLTKIKRYGIYGFGGLIISIIIFMLGAFIGNIYWKSDQFIKINKTIGILEESIKNNTKELETFIEQLRQKEGRKSVSHVNGKPFVEPESFPQREKIDDTSSKQQNTQSSN